MSGVTALYVLRVLPLLLLPGCSLSFDEWVTRRDAVLCRLHVDCFGTFVDVAACEADQQDFDEPPCPEFSGPAANACLDLLAAQAADCPSADIAMWQIPATCADVCTPEDVTVAVDETDGTSLAPAPDPNP